MNTLNQLDMLYAIRDDIHPAIRVLIVRLWDNRHLFMEVHESEFIGGIFNCYFADNGRERKEII